ncbi:MAG TPA: hypothetical protein VF683_03765, partial [Chthoniobacterales bacterium]
MSVAKRTPELPVGHDEPRTPKHSLPSYKEPTPETHRKLTREDEAEIALKRTVFTQLTPHVLIGLFVVTIAAVPLMQFAAEFRRGDFRTLAAFKAALPTRHGLPRAEDLKAAEKTLETDSAVSQWLLPAAQALLVGKLRAANEQVYLGRNGWLFYRPDVDYVTGPPFLAQAQLRRRSHAAEIQPDPVKAIVSFRDQLAARGIDLVLLPVPTKATVHGEMLSERAGPNEALQNASFAEFLRRMDGAGVRVFDPTALLMGAKSGALYLQADTHWRPETMQLVARQLAGFLNLGTATDAEPLQILEKEVAGVGDIARMLKLPADAPTNAPQRVAIQQVTNGNSLWRPTREADVLL